MFSRWKKNANLIILLWFVGTDYGSNQIDFAICSSNLFQK